MYHAITIIRKGVSPKCRDGATGFNSEGKTAEVSFNGSGRYTRIADGVTMHVPAKTLVEAIAWMTVFLSGVDDDPQ